MRIIRRVCFVLACLSIAILGWGKPTTSVAQSQFTGDRAAPLLNPEREGTQQAFEAELSGNGDAGLYATIAYPGTAFHRRNSSVSYAYYGGGCSYLTAATSSTIGDNDALSTRLDLPNGATIVGIEFQYRDSDASNDSRFYLQRFNGAGAVVSIATLTSSGNGGFGSKYTASNLNTLYDPSTYAYSLIWYPGAVGVNHALCGVRVKYSYAAPQPTHRGGNNIYSFTAASDFVAFDRTSRYSYGGAGCLIQTAGLNFSAEADIPEGMALIGYNAYYVNTISGASMNAHLLKINGASSSTVLSASTTRSTGYTNEFFEVTTPQIADELNYGYSLAISSGASAATMMCGIRTVANLPIQAHSAETTPSSPSINNHYQFITPHSFVPRDSNHLTLNDTAGCIAFGSAADLSYSLQLPPNSGIFAVRFYYRNQANNSVRAGYSAFDGRGWFNSILALSVPLANSYTSSSATYTGSYYTLHNGNVAHAITWSSLNNTSTVEFCGAQIWYTTGLRSTYIPAAFK